MIGHWHYIRHCLIQISPIRKPSRGRPALLEVSSIRFRVVLSTFSFTGKGGASCASHDDQWNHLEKSCKHKEISWISSPKWHVSHFLEMSLMISDDIWWYLMISDESMSDFLSIISNEVGQWGSSQLPRWPFPPLQQRQALTSNIKRPPMYSSTQESGKVRPWVKLRTNTSFCPRHSQTTVYDGSCWHSWKAQVRDLCIIARVILNPNTLKPTLKTSQNHRKIRVNPKTLKLRSPNTLNPKTTEIDVKRNEVFGRPSRCGVDGVLTVLLP